MMSTYQTGVMGLFDFPCLSANPPKLDLSIYDYFCLGPYCINSKKRVYSNSFGMESGMTLKVVPNAFLRIRRDNFFS